MIKMDRITTGSWIKRIRTEQRVSKAVLSEGLCVYQLLQKIEEGRAECSLELFTILLQRLGKSPDKLEYILSWREYRIQCIRDWFMVCVFKGNRKWAERALSLYEQKEEETGSVKRMYLCRGYAMIAYWIGHDADAAERWLKEALDATFQQWDEQDWTGHRISVLELENALALVRVCREQGKPDHGLLVRCGRYIQEYVTDGEEHAKIYSKYAWLTAEECCREGHIEQALSLCMEGLEELRQYSIEYFMEPLLEKLLQCYEKLRSEGKESGGAGAGTDGSAEERLDEERCRIYLRVLRHMREQFGEAWYPEDSILWNCCYKMYHLDYEIFFAERRVQGMTQERAADGVYQSFKGLGEIERGKRAPSRKNFLLLMRKFGMERERKASLVFSDSFEVLELRRRMQGCGSRCQYDTLERLLGELEQKLDMKVLENWRTVRFYQNTLDMLQEARPFEEMMAEDFRMLHETYRLSLEEIKNQPSLAAAPRKNGRGRPKKEQEQKGWVYRAPLKNEADILNQIAILLKKMGRLEEAIQVYEGVLYAFERSRIRPEYRFNSYALLLGNMAKERESIEETVKVLRVSLRCGKLSNMGDNYLTIACAMLDCGEERELSRRMMLEAYYLLELEKNVTDKNIVRDHYRKVFGKGLEED